MITISLITDELSADPETAIEMAAGWGIRHFELRGFYTDRVPKLSGYQKLVLKQTLDDYGAQVVAISPGLFKMPFAPKAPYRWSFSVLDVASYESWAETQRQVKYHLDELLPASLDYAAELGAKYVVTFGFGRGGAPTGPPPDEVLNALRLAAERAEAAGITLAVETEEDFWADTGGRTAALIRSINHSALRVNWDPGNSFCAGDVPYPSGYDALRGLIAHVHFKDARRVDGGPPEFAIEGEIDWPGQIDALVKDGYDGCISIETHQRPKLARARASYDRLKMLIEQSERTTQHT